MAFDDDLSTAWDGCCSGYPNQEIQYTLDRARPVSGYQIATSDGECPVAWDLESSDDGVTWNRADHQEAQICHDGDFIVYQLESHVTAQYWRWTFAEGVGGNSNGIRLKEIKLLYCSC
jgi:hypothetical protein